MKSLLLLLLFISIESSAQTGYKIDFKVKGLKDTTIYLAYYYGDATFLKDTAHADTQGRFTFEGKQRLDRGVYFLVIGKTKLFDPGFIVDQQQYFLMETNTEDYIKNMKVKGDDDNTLFFENMLYNAERHQEAEPFLKIIQDSTLKEDQKKQAREAFSVVSKKVQAHQEEIVAKNPGALTSRLLKITMTIEVPDPPKKADGIIDSLFQFRYYRKHYFDNFDLADDALIRIPKPFYLEKVTEYLDKLNIQTPDSIMAGIEVMASKARKNKETFKFLLWSCVYKYQKPAIMGLDEVYVRLYDKYYASGEMDFWMNAPLKKTMKEYAEKLRPSLVGKKGANLIMQDQSFQPKSLYDIKKKYSIIYFFDPDCGHCREESPKLVEFYGKQKMKFNLEVFAVSIDTSMQKMRTYIKEMKMTWITVNGPRSYVGSLHSLYYSETTPTLYVLDENKKIIAKGLPVDRLEEFLTNYERFAQRKSTAKAKGT